MRIATGLKRTLTLIAFVPLAMFGITHAAHAGIFTHGDTCQQYWNLPATDLLYGVDGVRNQSSVPRYVVCAVPRHQISAGSYPSHLIYVAGTNSPGARTSCTIYAIHPRWGAIVAKSFTRTEPYYEAGDWFTTAEMPYAGYISVLCYLPPNSTGILRGIMSSSS